MRTFLRFGSWAFAFTAGASFYAVVQGLFEGAVAVALIALLVGGGICLYFDRKISNPNGTLRK